MAGRVFELDSISNVAMAGIQIFNLLLVLLMLAAATVVVVTLIKVLFKLNKALDIWLKEKESSKNDTGA